MPSPLSALNKGIKFESSVGNTTNLRLENLTLSGVPFASGDLLDTPSGGVVITLNPDKQNTAKTVTVLEGKYIDIALEFDGAGQFRFRVTPPNDSPTVTGWMPEKTEHTLGVSYNSITNLLVVSTDGASTQRITDLSVFENSSNLKVFNPGNGLAGTVGTYDGVIGQLALFKAEPTTLQLDRLTINPDVIRADFGSVDLPFMSNSIQGNLQPGESQKITLSGSYAATASEFIKGFTRAEVQSISLTGTVSQTTSEVVKGNNTAEIQSVSLAGVIAPSASELIKGRLTPETQKISIGGVANFPAVETSASVPIAEVQKVSVSGTADSNFTLFCFAIYINIIAGTSASGVASRIATYKNDIKANNPLISDIYSSGSDLIVTYFGSAGDVRSISAIALGNGIALSESTETTKGGNTSEVQKLTLVGTATGTSLSTLGGTTTIAVGDSASQVAAKIAANAAAIKTANNTIDTITASGAELTITYLNTLGDVAEASAITGSGISTVGSFSALGASTTVASGDTATQVAAKIAANSAAIKAATPTIDTITASGADLNITYLYASGDVTQASSQSAVNGLSLSNATELTPNSKTAEVQKLTLVGTASGTSLSTLGGITTIAVGDSASQVAAKIAANAAAIKTANNTIDTITASGAELTITYLNTLGDVAEASAITGSGISTVGSFSALGASTTVASGDTATQVAAKIAANSAAIKAATPTIDTITASGADLNITYLLSAGDVAQASAVPASNGVSISAANEVTKGVKTAEVQKLTLVGTATGTSLSTLGGTTTIAVGDSASQVAAKIAANAAAIKTANNTIDTITASGAELTITYLNTLGDVAEASAITGSGISTVGSFSALGASTTVASGDTATQVAAKIAANSAAIKAATPTIDTITASGADLNITYLLSAGDVAQASAVPATNGVSISAANEVTKGVKTAEVQKLTLVGTATGTSLSTLGGTTTIAVGDSASQVAAKIAANAAAIKTANNTIDTITASGAELTITYLNTLGDVAEASAITGSGISTVGSFSALGASTTVASGDTATQVAAKIAANSAAIKAATPTIDTITASGADLNITYLLSAGDVPQASAVAAVNGIALGAAVEVSKPVTITSETQTVVLSGTATSADVVTYLGVPSSPLASGALAPSDVVTAILTNKAAILAGATAKAAKIINLSATAGNPNALTLTYSADAGDVANAAAITTASNGITFGAGTEAVKGATGIAETHTVTLGGSYKAGDKIAISSVDLSLAPVTKTYTVLSSDIKSTALATQSAVAASLAASFANQLGVYSVASSTNTVVLTGANSAGNLPDPTITFTTASGLVENGLQDYFDFTKIALLASSVTGAGGGVATFSSESGAALGVTSQDYSGSSVVAPPTGPTTTLPVNGPIYARLKSYTKDSTTSVPKFTYELFVNKAANLTSLNSVGFTLDFDETKADFVSFVPLGSSGGMTLQDVNTLQARDQGKVTYQWAATPPGVTDFSLPVAELTLNLKGTAPFNANTATPSVGMELSNISVNSTFFTQTGTTLPLVISAPLDAERYVATGVIQQVFTNPTPSSPQTSYAQAGTVVGYEVFGTQSSPAVRLDIKDTYAATRAASSNAIVQLDIIANSLPTVGSKFSMVVNLPSNATGATLTAAPGVTLVTTASVLSGTQFKVEGTYAAPAGVTTTTPTLGTIAMTLVREHNAGSDFSISDLTFNGAAAVGRSLYFGLAESNASGALNMLNLPKGEMVIKVFDNPLALTSAASLSSLITIEDARAVMTIASGKNNGALNASTPGTPWAPSDYIAADWDKNGVVSSADALAMLNYILATDKTTTTLDYIYIDAAANTLAKTPMSVSSVVVPPVTKIMTHKDLATDYNYADGHNDINIVGILVGDLVK